MMCRSRRLSCAAAAVALLTLGGCADPATQPGPPPPPGAVGEPRVGISALPAVPPGDAARFADVPVTATVRAVTAVKVEAQGPGEIVGPGASVVVDVTNDSAADIEATAFTVNAYRPDGSPLNPSSAPPAMAFTGVVEPGATISGTFVFQLGDASADQIRIEVGYSGSANLVVIQPG